MQAICKFIFFRLFGWSITGDVPRNISKYIIIAAPHSSNLDFFVGLMVRAVLRFRAGYLGKKELFRFPFGAVFRWLGGYPVDRKSSHNLVSQVVDIIERSDYFVLAIAPEGTRKKVDKWKTGFYYIALKAKIPLVMAAIDYSKRNVKFSQPINLTGNINDDEKSINDFYKGVKGKNHEAALFKV